MKHVAHLHLAYLVSAIEDIVFFFFCVFSISMVAIPGTTGAAHAVETMTSHVRNCILL